MVSVSDLSIAIYADGADLETIAARAKDPLIKGFTTNPTLMRKSGIQDYEGFAKDALALVGDRSISFEVFADDFPTMEKQARRIASWGKNVSVKIPITNTKGESAASLIRTLSADGVSVNVTAIMTEAQVKDVADALSADTSAIVSVFAGRIADTGRDPVPMMQRCKDILNGKPMAQLLWASPREVLNLFQADAVGCEIITMTDDLLKKLGGTGKDLDVFSLETVKMFFDDATSAGYDIAVD
ncbi:transaldolase [uncultured Nisaea sp.]|uniref:transaldolase n=1 Tax=uncultured Nisaea sp. TaxID=538215 RepID=UPI0030EBA46B|tara:strand:- start:13646 stop:14371 length:726 start_codon:yes stop_codon:yes gene_type:complete